MTGHAPGSSARTRAADETTRRPAHEQDVPVFAWITGERTNVGDSLLRRPYVAALRRIGRLELWIRTSTPDFLTGLSLDDDVVLTPGFAVWYARLLRSALRRRTVVVLNAGESRVEGSRALLLSALLVAGLVVRVRGGSSVWRCVSSRRPPPSALRRPAWAGPCRIWSASRCTAAPSILSARISIPAAASLC